MSAGTPPAEFDVTVELARALVTSQHSDLAALPIEPLAHGWDNALFRLGENLVLRLPRRQLGADFIEKEQHWLPFLAPQLPIPIPAPIRTGKPQAEYPWHWSITPYFVGEILGERRLNPAHISQLVGFLHALHQSATSDAPENDYRGGPLTDKNEQVQARFELLKPLDLPWAKIYGAWVIALGQPFPGRSVWIHGDIHARNLLVKEDQIAAVLDWGDVCVGDPATDLAALLLTDNPEEALRQYGAGEAMKLRAIGWAIHFALMYAEAGEQGDPVFRTSGHRILTQVARLTP